MKLVKMSKNIFILLCVAIEMVDMLPCRINSVGIYSKNKLISCIPCINICPVSEAQFPPCNTNHYKNITLKCVSSPSKGHYYIRNNQWIQCRHPCDLEEEVESTPCTYESDRKCMCKHGYYRDPGTNKCDQRCSLCKRNRITDYVPEGYCLSMGKNLRCKEEKIIKDSTTNSPSAATSRQPNSSSIATTELLISQSKTTTELPNSSFTTPKEKAFSETDATKQQIVSTSTTTYRENENGIPLWVPAAAVSAVVVVLLILIIWKVYQRGRNRHSQSDINSISTGDSIALISQGITLDSAIGDPDNFPFAFKTEIINKFENRPHSVKKAKAFVTLACKDAQHFVHRISKFEEALDHVMTRVPETTFRQLTKYFSNIGCSDVGQYIKARFP
ncbi:uncharacterized protein LOC130645771 [Hydractinia symbiolongicarpus]|uniref:uncharacterized protein LOC130645771 n=1 Tax=Hydractinia symbiolongicarpus TaxID=13093 RepID=UPI00254BA54F|nr:uncharacterized protein LOC130645771 [Hydractinia symbiolongicarpus]